MMIALTACGPDNKAAAAPTADYSPDVRVFMEKFNQCYSQTNADCMASLFTSSGSIYDTGLVQASGPDAIRKYLDQSFSAAHIVSFASTIDSIAINGNVAVVIGTYDEKVTDTTNQNYEIKLRYVAEWIQQPNSWILNRMSTHPIP